MRLYLVGYLEASISYFVNEITTKIQLAKKDGDGNTF